LIKTFHQVSKFIKLQKQWKYANSFANVGLNSHRYKSNFDQLNNYSMELEYILENFKKEDKEFMYNLYQILSNNIEIGMRKIKSIKNPYKNENIFTEPFTIINEKYEILEEISRDEVFKVWVFHKCKNLKKNKFYGVRIINKSIQNRINFGSFINKDIHIENRMACLKYSLKIKEIISNNSFDYVITEYVDCSLYYLINKTQFDDLYLNGKLKIEIVWKLLRDLFAAVDYCHNIAKIAHRNLNLKNIFFNRKEISLRISDYSFSSILEETEEYLPLDKSYTGCFPPPEFHDEYYSGESGDIWACGIIIFFILNNYLPTKICLIPEKIK
jgi:hypothetical protein